MAGVAGAVGRVHRLALAWVFLASAPQDGLWQMGVEGVGDLVVWKKGSEFGR